MRVRAAASLVLGAFFFACEGSSPPVSPPTTSGGASGGAAAGSGGAGGSGPSPSCDRPLPSATTQGASPTCRFDEDCAGDGAFCELPARPFGLLCVVEAECTRSNFFACERGGLCAPKCLSDAACPAFERCLEGRCRARPCEEGVCPAGATCGPTFTCEPVPCAPGEGTCGEQELCVAGDPSFPCVPKPCTEDAACAPAGLCIVGGCRAKVCACDADCGTEAYCIGGRCSREPGVCAREAVPTP